MPSWSLRPDDIDRLAIGLAVLGAGGGGDTYAAAALARQQLVAGGTIELMRPDDLADDAVVLPVSALGAPSIGQEILPSGDEVVHAVTEMERLIGRRVDAVIADEIGGMNGITPLLASARLGIPVVDADGMGRAFPESQMTTFFIGGQPPAPAVLTDAHGNVVVATSLRSAADLERISRAVAVAMGGTAYTVTAPLSGRFVKAHAVRHTVSLGWRLGQAVLAARGRGVDPVAALIDEASGSLVFDGKVVEVQRSRDGGFDRASVVVADAGRRLSIDVRNEFLVAWEHDEAVAMVPDIITLLDRDTARPIPTDEVRFGQRVAVVAIASSVRLRSPEALAVVGPAAFGYHVPFVPIAAPLDAHPHHSEESRN